MSREVSEAQGRINLRPPKRTSEKNGETEGEKDMSARTLVLLSGAEWFSN